MALSMVKRKVAPKGRNFLNDVFKKELRRRRKEILRKKILVPPSLTLKKFWSPPLWPSKKEGHLFLPYLRGEGHFLSVFKQLICQPSPGNY